MTPTAPARAGSRNHPRNVVGVVLAFVGAVALTIGAVGSPAAGLTDTQIIPLGNSDGDVGSDCPDAAGDYWNFIILPDDGTYSFVTISLNLGGSVVDFEGAAIISNGGLTDNVFVAVPDGYGFDDLDTFGSEAEISPGSGSSYRTEFIVAYRCEGSGPPTTPPTSTPTTPATSAPTTTPTTPATSAPTTAPTTPATSAPTTTPTTPATSTPTSVGNGPPTVPTTPTTLPCEWEPTLPPDHPDCYQGTPTSVASGPPTTTATGGNSPTTVLAQLPRTGSDSTNTSMVLGALMLLVGGVMLLSSRREHELG